MKKLLLVLTICFSLALPGFAQQLATGSLSASASACQPSTKPTACVFLAMGPATNTAGVSVAGTYSGTLQFEGSVDNGATWASVQATPSSGGSAVTSTTSTGTWTIPSAGYSYIRVRCSTYSSGVATVTLNPSQAVTASVSSGGGSGTVTSVAETVPSWLAVGGSPVTTSGTFAVTAATGQTSHQVIGTCGSATAFSPCALTTSDMPTGVPTALSGNTTTAATAAANLAGAATGNIATTDGSGNVQSSGTALTSLAPLTFGGTLLDPTKYAYFFDDFLGWSTTSVTTTSIVAQYGGIGTSWTAIINGSGSVVGVQPWDAGAYGVAVLTTGATSANSTGITNASNASWVLNASTFDYTVRAKIGATTSTSSIFGFIAGSLAETSATDAIVVAYDTSQSDTAWMAVCKASSTATRTAIAGTLDTNYHTFHVWATVAGTINFTVDGGATTTISTNVPSAALAADLAVVTRTTAAKNIHIDYVRFYENVSR